MLSKWALAMAGLAVVAATSAWAQSDPIAARMALMKGNNDNFRNISQMLKGQQPFDAAKVDAAFAQWAKTARELPGLFPPDSQTGEKTRALPAIWENKQDFDAKAAAFAKVVAENRDKARASLDGLRAAAKPVGDACDNCHKDYRRSQR
jgi:cytochrome c556